MVSFIILIIIVTTTTTNIYYSRPTLHLSQRQVRYDCGLETKLHWVYLFEERVKSIQHDLLTFQVLVEWNNMNGPTEYVLVLEERYKQVQPVVKKEIT